MLGIAIKKLAFRNIREKAGGRALVSVQYILMKPMKYSLV